MVKDKKKAYVDLDTMRLMQKNFPMAMEISMSKKWKAIGYSILIDKKTGYEHVHILFASKEDAKTYAKYLKNKYGVKPRVFGLVS